MSELSTRARELIAAVDDGDGPTSAEKARLRAAVLARVGTAVAVGSAVTAVAANAKGMPSPPAVPTTEVGANAGATVATTATKTSLAVLGAKWLIVVTIVAGATGYVAVSSRRGNNVAVTVPQSSPRAELSPKTPAAAPPPPLAPEILPSPPAAAFGRALRRAEPVTGAVHSASPAPGNASSTPRPSGTLDSETAGLAAALGALRDGTPDQALSLLDEQDARYPEGVLGEERAATRIYALCDLGRTDEARSAADRFLASHPHSLLRSRVSAACLDPWR